MPFNSDEYNDDDVGYLDINKAIELIDIENDYFDNFDSLEDENYDD